MRQVISASRRTDMPACHLDRLLNGLRRGYAEVPNPFSGKVSLVDLRRESVHTIVLWSKDFGPFLGERRHFEGYNMYFLFTVNDMPALEPGVPPLAGRLEQVRELAGVFGPRRVAWRFDPVVFGRNGPHATMDSFIGIGRVMAGAGVKRVIISFMDMYGKVRDRVRRYGLDIIEPGTGEMREYARRIVSAASSLGLEPESCCEDLGEGMEALLPAGRGCIDGTLLSDLAGEEASRTRDRGQRSGCSCTVSRDIGSYRDMPCSHGCLYCYANPLIGVHGEVMT